MRVHHLLFTALIASACADTTAPPPLDAPAAALVAMDGSIPGHYIVAATWNADAAGVAAEYGLAPRHVYEHLLNGFAAAIPDAVVQALASDPRVLRISVQRQLQKVETVTELAASWGLDRVDQRLLPLNGTYTYDVTAHKVRAYIIDTGIRYSHQEFEGRAVFGFDAFANDPADALLYDGSGDCDGHGTHVAGTAGGRTYGIAKQVQLVGVRVLNCAGYGSDADVIAGMDWVGKNGVLPASANMSLGDVVPSKALGLSSEIDNAVKALVASGVSLSVAAGNGWAFGAAPGSNSCDFPIANVPEAITVAASTITDTQTSWTSYGPCVDVYAPGSGILSADNTSDTATRSASGTSMASPHVSGVAALVLAQAPGATPAEVRDVIVNGATRNVLAKNPNNVTAALDPTPLLLLYSRAQIPSQLRGKHGSSLPCTPKRRLNGVC
jgi:subtilisin family serine protease